MLGSAAASLHNADAAAAGVSACWWLQIEEIWDNGQSDSGNKRSCCGGTGRLVRTWSQV